VQLVNFSLCSHEWTDPYALHIESHSIGWYPLVVRRLKDVISPRTISEAFPKLEDGFLELFRHKDFVR